MFFDKIQNICNKNKKVAMFIDMDGTIVEYPVFTKKDWFLETKNEFLQAEPLIPVIEVLKDISNIENIDLYILSLAKTTAIVEEKREWLKKYVSFIPEKNWIILNKEKEEYTKENRDRIKCEKMKEKLAEYDHAILLDDDHKILKVAQVELEDKGTVFHLSSALI